MTVLTQDRNSDWVYPRNTERHFPFTVGYNDRPCNYTRSMYIFPFNNKYVSKESYCKEEQITGCLLSGVHSPLLIIVSNAASSLGRCLLAPLPLLLSSLFNNEKICILISIQRSNLNFQRHSRPLLNHGYLWLKSWLYWSINYCSPLCRLLICMLSSSDCKVLVPLLNWNTLECIELCARSFPFDDEGEKLHICTSVHLFCVFGGAFYFPSPMSTSFTLPLTVWLVSCVLDNCCYYSFGVFAQPNSPDTVAFCVLLSPLQGSVAFGSDRHVYLFNFAQ